MRHAIEEEEKIPLEQVTNFNEVRGLFFYLHIVNYGLHLKTINHVGFLGVR